MNKTNDRLNQFELAVIYALIASLIVMAVVFIKNEYFTQKASTSIKQGAGLVIEQDGEVEQ